MRMMQCMDTSLFQGYCTPEQWQQLKAFVEFLVEANAGVNVVSRRDIGQLMPHHVAPCFIYRALNRFAAGERVIDIGAGGGFPGIVNAILFPDVQFTLVDSTNKKIAVLREAIAELGLKNAEAVWGRVEKLAEVGEYAHQFDHTTSRAVAPLAQLVEWSRPLLKPSGTVEAMKGGDVTEELSMISEKSEVLTLPEALQLNEKLVTVKLITVKMI